MKTAMRVLGGLFLAAGVISGIVIVAGAAIGREGFTTLLDLIPWLALHVASMFVGMACFAPGARPKKPAGD